jgi:hypothetical protein
MTPRQAVMLAALQKAYAGDRIFRPSAAARWGPEGCPASVQAIAGLPKELRNSSGPSARQGSGAHALGEIILKSRWEPTGRQSPEEYIGRKVAINGARADDLTSDPEDFILVDAEMAEKIGEYVAVVDQDLGTPNTELYVERKLTLAHLDPSNPLFAECTGTSDAALVNRTSRWAKVKDLKYGMDPVSATAPQLKIYGLMLMLEFHQTGIQWDWIGTEVFQPRLPYPKYSEDDWHKIHYFKPKELIDGFMPQVVMAMEAALEPDPVYKPSLTACKWCPLQRNARCTAFQNWAVSIGYDPLDRRLQEVRRLGALPDFLLPDPGKPVPYQEDVVVLPDIAGMSGADTGRILDGEDAWKAWWQSVKHHAVQLEQAGIDVPGYGIKRQSKHRVFAKPVEDVVKALTKQGLKRADLFVAPKLKTPAAIEKLLPRTLRGMLQPDFGLVEKPEGEYQLVADDSLNLVRSDTSLVDFTVGEMNKSSSVNDAL